MAKSIWPSCYLSGALLSLEIVQNVGAYLSEHGPHTVLIQSWASEANHDNGLAIYIFRNMCVCDIYIYIYVCVCMSF